jgi:hypothetical protein
MSRLGTESAFEVLVRATITEGMRAAAKTGICERRHLPQGGVFCLFLCDRLGQTHPVPFSNPIPIGCCG